MGLNRGLLYYSACCLMMAVLPRLASTGTCPHYCSCDRTKVECLNGYKADLGQLIPQFMGNSGAQNLTIYKVFIHKVPAELTLLWDLRYLSITHCRVEEIEDGAFLQLGSLQELHLDHNHIHQLPSEVFLSLLNLKILKLTHNHIESLPDHIFGSLEHLEVLGLKNNKLDYLDVKVFQNLRKLKTLDISYNELTYLHPAIFKPMSFITVIHMSSNLLKTVHRDIFQNLPSLKLVSLEENPWDCNCGLKWLAKALKHNMPDQYPVKYKHPEMIKCSTPSSVHSHQLKHVPLHSLNCTAPTVYSNNDTIRIVIKNDLTMRCMVAGEPAPSIVWLTPHGYMTALKHSWWLTPDITNISTEKFVHILPLYETSNLSVLDNGDLHIDKMRQYFAGEYTCLAINPGGVDSVSVNVTLISPLDGQDLINMIHGATMVAGTIVLALFICGIHQITRPKCCNSETKSISVNSCSPRISPNLSLKYTPGDSPCKYSSAPSEDERDLYYCGSEEECNDTDNSAYKTEHANNKIRETLDEVRIKLRLSKAQLDERLRERRIRMQNQLQSIRESGSQYLQTIRDSSSQYANRVRAGVATGVEHVKYNLKSLKEFCGTGDIGQTMSRVTISTDVDTAERIEMVKNVTLV